MKRCVLILTAASALTTLAAASNPVRVSYHRPQQQTIKPVTARQSVWGTITQWIFGSGE